MQRACASTWRLALAWDNRNAIVISGCWAARIVDVGRALGLLPPLLGVRSGARAEHAAIGGADAERLPLPRRIGQVGARWGGSSDQPAVLASGPPHTITSGRRVANFASPIPLTSRN